MFPSQRVIANIAPIGTTDVAYLIYEHPSDIWQKIKIMIKRKLESIGISAHGRKYKV